MRRHYWAELTTRDFESLDAESTIVVLPVAAIEQHGPHLPVYTDTMIAEGMIAQTLKLVPDDLNVLVMPTQAIGKSNEHLRSPGTITLSAETALRAWVEIGEAVSRAGLRKLVMVNSHGGNVDLLNVVARELRVRFQLLAVTCGWRRFGLPAGMYTQVESEFGIHAGDVETSLMLHFRPDLVRMEHARNFEPSILEMSRTFKHLKPIGSSAFGWIAQDINPDGAAGDASLGTAEKGRLTCEHQAKGFIELLRDVRDFSLSRLA